MKLPKDQDCYQISRWHYSMQDYTSRFINNNFFGGRGIGDFDGCLLFKLL